MNSHKRVEDFIIKRAAHYNVRVQFCSDFPTMIDHGEVHVYSSVLDPFSDYDELFFVLEEYKSVPWDTLEIKGLVPGTQFQLVKRSGDGISRTYYSNKQTIYNSQVNLYKFKRLKLFLGLLDRIEELHTYSLSGFLKRLDENDIFEFVLSYGESVTLTHFDRCPICESHATQKIYSNDSQPLIGFMTRSRSVYTRCLACELIFLNPCPSANDLPKVYDIFDKNDFISSINSPFIESSQRCRFIQGLPFPIDCRALDLGGGIGEFSKFLKGAYPDWEVYHGDFDIKRQPEIEKIGIKTFSIDVSTDKIGGIYDLITMWEVIEHIHPERLSFVLDNIADALRVGGALVFSTPNFDSPLCRTHDFYSACPPFHTFVFSERWLTRLFENHPKFFIERIGFCSDFMDDIPGWMDYAALTSPSISSRGTAEFLKELYNHSKSGTYDIVQRLRGSEVIYCLRRK